MELTQEIGQWLKVNPDGRTVRTNDVRTLLKKCLVALSSVEVDDATPYEEIHPAENDLGDK